MKTVRLALFAALGAASLLAMGPGSDARPRQPPPPPPPPVDTMPSAGLSPILVQQAAVYHSYMQRASAIDAHFSDPTSVATALRSGAAYEPRQFLRGALAYAAIAAMQDPAFVASMRAVGHDRASRQALEYALLSNPQTVMQYPAAANAAALAVAALHGEGLRLYTTGRAVKQAAYDTQHQAWANTRIQGTADRLAAVRNLSETPVTPDLVEAARLGQSTRGGQSLGLTPDPAAQAPYSPLVARAVSLAALASVGMAGDQALDRIMPNLTDPEATFCLSMAKLNLYQCLAVAGPQYEDMFCLGQHVLMDTGACLIRGSGVALPVEARPPPPASRRPHPPRRSRPAHR